MVEILATGISYKTAPVEVRERFSFSTENLHRALRLLSQKKNVYECCIISTCNRVEIYAVTEDLVTCEHEIKSFLADFHKLPQQNFASHFYTISGRDAARHLFQVAASIDSMVIGETQILRQLKNSYNVALEEKSVGLILNKLFNRAFFVGKKVRTETGISSQAISISYLGVELAKRIFENLEGRTAMLIGTGEMGELLAKHLVSNKIEELYVVSRNFLSAKKFTESVKGSRAVRFEDMFYLLKNIDILITATGSADYIIKSEHVRQSLRLRKNEPIFMIDIAVPRDIDPKINSISGVYLYDIDDLKVVQGENLNSRKKSLEKAEQIISRVERNFASWTESLKVFPTIVGLKQKFERIREVEVEKALRKINDKGLENRDIIERLAQSLIGKIFHDPITNLKKRSSGYEAAIYSEVARKLFDLDSEDSLQNTSDIYEDAENWDQR